MKQILLDSIVPKKKILKYLETYTQKVIPITLKGIENSEFKYICVLDGDGQNPI